MALDRKRILQLIDRLDHPDGHMQEGILQEFTQNVSEVRPLVHGNLAVSAPRVRRALLRWLSTEHDESSTLPLMRYVFDHRRELEELTGRQLAMVTLLRRAQATNSPEEQGRLRAFAEDISTDSDSEIRRRALEILANIGNQRSIPIVEAALTDADKEVQEAARKSLTALESAPEDSGGPEMSVEALTKALLFSLGARRRQLVRQWRRHDLRGEVALEILRHGEDLESEALQILLTKPRLEARAYLPAKILANPEDERAIFSLRLLARLATSFEIEDVRSDELEAIRKGLNCPALLTKIATVNAIEALRLERFFPDLLELVLVRDQGLCLAVAKALDELSSPKESYQIATIIQGIELNARRRLQSRDDKEGIEIIAHLQSALRKSVAPDDLRARDCQVLALNQLARHEGILPIEVTALQILLASTPARGLEEERRLYPSELSPLLQLASREDHKIAIRVATLLERLAPRGLEALADRARALMKTGGPDLEEHIIPLLLRSDCPKAKVMLEEIAEGANRQAASRAREILRQSRNESEYIDAEYIPADKKP